MVELLRLILHIVASLFKSRAKLAAEILVLRQQLNVLRRQVSKRPQLSNTDRFLFVWLYRWLPSVLGAIAIFRPETIIRWHRAGFRSYWRGRSRNRVGRPRISAELRNLIGAMSRTPGSPWQNGIAERLIGTVRRECLDRILIFGESHLRRVLASYATYYNQTRTHLALQKDAPLRRAVQRSGAIVAIPILAGLHHQYIRI